jgi:hypothetical protein
MANYTTLYITGFGEQKYLAEFDNSPPKFKGPDIQIINNPNSRTIIAEFRSQLTTEVLNGLIAQMPDLSLLVDINIEPGYCELLYRKNCQYEFKQLFEIRDTRDDEFFINFKSGYFDSFDKIDIGSELTGIISGLPTGKTYINLLENPEYYRNRRKAVGYAQ